MDSSRPQEKSADYTAKSLEEALAEAARDLGVPASELKYEILEDTTRTLFGLVRTGEMVVRVQVPPRDDARVGATAKMDHALPPPAAESAAGPASTPDARGSAGQMSAALERNPPELMRVSSEVVATLVDKMGIIAAVEVSDEGGEVDEASSEVSPLVLNIVGDDLGVLIGRRGDTLQDLQFMVRLLVSRKLGVWPNLVLDVEAYKAKRVLSLRALAERMGDQARETGEPVVLEPMPAYERRIIHLALRDDPDVYTESVGQDEMRKVQILPR